MFDLEEITSTSFLIAVIGNATMAMIRAVYYGYVLTPKTHKSVILGLQSLFLFLLSCSVLAIYDNLLLKQALGLFFVISFVFFLFSDSFGKKVFAVLTDSIVLGLSELTVVMTSSITGITIRYIEKNPQYMILMISFDCCIMAILYYLTGIFIKRNTHSINLKMFVCFSVFPLSQLILMVVIYATGDKLMKAYPAYVDQYVPIIMLGTIICFTADFLLLKVIQSVTRKKELEVQNYYLKEEQELQKQHYMEMQIEEQTVKKLRHDIVNHMYTIRTLLEKNQADHANAYAQELEKKYQKSTGISYCENWIVDAVLYDKIRKAHSLGIQTVVDVSVARDSPIDDLDLMCVFSNLLDNAIEANEGEVVKDKYLSITAQNNAGFLVIKVENSCDSTAKPKSKEGKYHRLGLKIVKEMAEKYDGALELISKEDIYITLVSMRESE
ncbi:sensor histidine kinase [Anaeromassilibacillus senegalensis]|uniref:sensor histidine kinase n=1 Tax=Anaeromassilibacillus senegalensis TaxID=1673717 RepID=UPI0009E38716|nr:sensor histidine kinase [Anaeromassilibacillus senegalensis]